MDTEVDWGTEDDFDPWAAGTSTSITVKADKGDTEEKTMVDSETEQPLALKPGTATSPKPITKEASLQEPIVPTESQPLPPDWITKTSRKDASKTYYYNTVTKEVSWIRPVPEDLEPETPPLPQQNLPVVQPIEGQGSPKEPEAIPARIDCTDDSKGNLVASTSSVTSPIEVDVSGIPSENQLPQRGVTPASPEAIDGPPMDRPSTARAGQIGSQGAASGRRRNGGRNRREKPDWRLRERRERASAPFRGGLPSQTAHHQRATSPPPRSSTGEVRRRDGNEETVEDRGLSKRPRVEPPIASRGGELQSQRLEASAQNTPSSSVLRSDGRDLRGTPNRNPEHQGHRMPSFLSEVNAIPTTRKMGGAIPPESVTRDMQRGPASSSAAPSSDRIAGPPLSTRHPSLAQPESRSEEHVYRERDSYRPGPDTTGRDRDFARASSGGDVPPHREAAKSSQSVRSDTYGKMDRYGDSARSNNLRDLGRAPDGYGDSKRGDPSREFQRRSPPRDTNGRRDFASNEIVQIDRCRDADLRASFPVRADGRPLPDRRSPPPYLQRNHDASYTPVVRSARSADETRSRGLPRSGPTNRIEESASSPLPATPRAVPFVHPSRLPALGASASTTSHSPQPQRDLAVSRPSLQDPRQQTFGHDRRLPAPQNSSSSANSIPVTGRPMNPPSSRSEASRNGYDRAGGEARFAAPSSRSELTRGHPTPEGRFNTPSHPGLSSRRQGTARDDRRFDRP